MGKYSTKKRTKRSFCGNQHVIVKNESSFKRKRAGRPSKRNLLTVLQQDCSPVAGPSHLSKQHPDADTLVSTPLAGKSVSFKKLFGARRVKHVEQPEKLATGYRFFDIGILSGVFDMLVCPDCMTQSLSLDDDLPRKNGCASRLMLVCKECEWSHIFFTSKQINGAFEVNKRLVYGMRSIGIGYSGAKKFCAVLNIPTLPTKNNFSKLNKTLLSAVYDVANDSMKQAGEEVKKTQIGENSADCGVSVDGCWQKRGFVSLNGCVAALSIDNGKVLDVEPMSRHCKQCQLQSKLDKNSKEYQDFKEKHIGCKASYRGSAPAMEPEGAVRMFSRSIEKHGLHYTKFYGDGDSKSYLSVKNVYESVGKRVEKLECIGHVQKRMGTALRKLKKEKRELGGKGKLTEKIIDKIQNYYGIAIRSNVGNLESMKKAILATLFHSASSKENNYHSYCPDGKDSWCGFKVDIAEKTKKFKPGPGLPLKVVAEMKPVFARLSQESLLKKCLHGKTQNQNESFNRVIWDRIPKSTYVGRDVFELGVYDAVAHFNEGSIATCLVLERLGLPRGFFTDKLCHELDVSRVYAAEYQVKKSTKLSRKKLRSRRKSRNDKDTQKEGDSYGAGEF
eukprot:gene1535-15984_t